MRWSADPPPAPQFLQLMCGSTDPRPFEGVDGSAVGAQSVAEKVAEKFAPSLIKLFQKLAKDLVGLAKVRGRARRQG